jgi:hypothetical protein
VHAPLQQSDGFWHVAPEAKQVDAAHRLLVQTLLQQSLGEPQSWPLEAQRLPAQMPALHDPAQQSVYCVQVAPTDRQIGATGLSGPASPVFPAS